MGKLSPILLNVEGGGLKLYCPGCKEHHSIQHGLGPGPCWSWNGSADKPSFQPSVLVTTGHFCSHYKQGDSCWCSYNAEHLDDANFNCQRCYSFITDGQIQFLSDSTHELAGQTVPLPTLPGGE